MVISQFLSKEQLKFDFAYQILLDNKIISVLAQKIKSKRSSNFKIRQKLAFLSISLLFPILFLIQNPLIFSIEPSSSLSSTSDNPSNYLGSSDSSFPKNSFQGQQVMNSPNLYLKRDLSLISQAQKSCVILSDQAFPISQIPKHDKSLKSNQISSTLFSSISQSIQIAIQQDLQQKNSVLNSFNFEQQSKTAQSQENTALILHSQQNEIFEVNKKDQLQNQQVEKDKEISDHTYHLLQNERDLTICIYKQNNNKKRYHDCSPINLPSLIKKHKTELNTMTQLKNEQENNLIEPLKQQNIEEEEQVESSDFTEINIKNNAKGKSEQQQRKCTCKKIECLKQYCDCFASGEFCGRDCKCINCQNTKSKYSIRSKIVDNFFKANPHALDSNYNNSLNFDELLDQVSNKFGSPQGCNCKKIKCNNKYCQCYANGLECGKKCKCSGCENCSSKKQKQLCK